MANTQIYQVLPSQPFGRGRHGATTLGSDPHTRRTGTGTSGTTGLTLNSAAFTNGDLILIIQHRSLSSASEVNWEINRIETGGGSTSLTLKNNLARNYSSAQVLDIKEYTSLTVNSFTASAWDGSTGGIIALACMTPVTWNGTITIKGADGGSSISDQGGSAGNGGGFRGGWNSEDGSDAARGEGYTGTHVSEGTSNNGNGGGGGGSGGDKGGAGGGSAAAGSNASSGSAVGGEAVGSTDLTSAMLGGGGGGGKNDGDQNAGGGGNGGGGIFLWFHTLNLTSGGVDLRGGTGGASTFGATSGGGGGGGGFGLINFSMGTVSTNFLASAGNGQNTGGNGGNGRFRINYGVSVTGATSPAASTNNDKFLNPTGGGSFMANFL